MRNQKSRGRKIVACFPLYPPLALFHAMGLVPVVPWGLRAHVSGTQTADGHLPPYTCSVARHMTEFLLGEARDLIDGFFMYNACDTLRNLPEILIDEMAAARRDVPFFHMHLPMTGRDQTDPSGYFKNEISALVTTLSDHFGIVFSPERFMASVDLYGQMRRLALEAGKRVAAGSLKFSDFAKVMQAGAFMPVEDHINALTALTAAGEAPPAPALPAGPGVGVLISGILPPPASVTASLESAGLRIVADDMASLYRSYAVMPDADPDPATYYRAFYDGHYPCPTLLYTADQRVDALVERAVRKNARGVVFIGEKFCEYEYFEFPFLRKKLAEKGIYTLEIEISIEDGLHTGVHDSRIAAFAEMIRQ